MDYWLHVFSVESWECFRARGANVLSIESRRKNLKAIKAGDLFLCYLGGVNRWVGAVETGDAVTANTAYPVNMPVQPIICLKPEHGVPMENLHGLVTFYDHSRNGARLRGFLRNSPKLFQERRDGQLVLSLLQDASENPVMRPVDPKKLGSQSVYLAITRLGDEQVDVGVTVPVREDGGCATAAEKSEPQPDGRLHTEIQYHLLKLGRDMGFDLWVARNDRCAAWSGSKLGEMPGVVLTLPTQFNDVTTKTIELIDVLWLRGNSIAAAFEVECTTAVYSGLLRMSDLLALQPNLDIRLFIVAPDNRRDKVQQEILRPTFRLREKPVHKVCGFIPYDTFRRKIETIQELKLATALRPRFLEQEAQYFAGVKE